MGLENSKNTRNELARPVMGTIFLVVVKNFYQLYSYYKIYAIKEDVNIAANSQGSVYQMYILMVHRTIYQISSLMAGFQNTLRSQNLSFNRIAEPYIQIVHI